MKKLLIIMVMGLLFNNISYSNVSAKLANIQKELEILEQNEINKFKAEEKKSLLSQKNYDNYIMMITASSSKVEEMNANVSTSLFPKEVKELIKKYETFIRDTTKEAALEKRKVDEFNQLKSILGY